MAGLEELKRRLRPLSFDADGSGGEVLEGGTVNLLSRSSGEYNISELGFHKRKAGQDKARSSEKAYRCSSREMHIFGSVDSGSSSVVHRAIFIRVHRIMALKKINVFEKDKREQILNELGTLSEACCYPGLVEFHGAFYKPNSGAIYFALEYMDGGSLADIIRVKKFIAEPVLAHMLVKVLPALRYLHEVKHVVHRDIKPANLLVNLKGDVKITDFGVTSGLHDSVSTCATFVGTVTYMSPERIRNYSYAADIWSLGLTVLECATGRFPYCVNGGLSDLMLQILDDPSPTPAKYVYSPEFCSFISACLQKDADARPTCEQLLSYPFIDRYRRTGVDLPSYFKSVHDPTEILWQIAHMLAVHYYLIFYGSDNVWRYMKTFYREESVFSFLGEEHVGQSDIFRTLSRIRKMLKGKRPRGKIVHVIEKVRCCAHGEEEGVAIRVSGSFIVGNELLVCEDGKRVGRFREEFFMEPGHAMGCFIISRQKLQIVEK
ncbi:hypothetical protein SETIT_6G160700v2 [Setaria italica]|uniref:mitogen-activated protein kinase kinase n=2 Tax=Setaria italica TaxID=4555 RepID=A0A368RNQ3_SETIT|nr:hypothetical protein SETIT_6G160700v2 [Setaria italica]